MSGFGAQTDVCPDRPSGYPLALKQNTLACAFAQAEALASPTPDLVE